MKKLKTSYTVSPENVEWIKERGRQEGRSASNFLDQLITEARKRIGKAK